MLSVSPTTGSKAATFIAKPLPMTNLVPLTETRTAPPLRPAILIFLPGTIPMDMSLAVQPLPPLIATTLPSSGMAKIVIVDNLLLVTKNCKKVLSVRKSENKSKSF